MGMLQLDPPIPLATPRGRGLAHVLLDYGPEYDLCWVVFLDETGECWTYRNPEVRALTNLTFGRILPDREGDAEQRLGPMLPEREAEAEPRLGRIAGQPGEAPSHG